MAAGKEIKRLRENQENKISVAKAASLIGIDPERLRKWEQRNTDPTDLEDAHKIEQYFGVALNDLKNLDTFQFIQGSYSKATTVRPITDIQYTNELKDRIKSLEDDKKFIHETYGEKIKQLQKSLDVVLKNQQLMQSQISVAFHLIVENVVDDKKRDEVLNEFDKLTFSDRH